MNRKNVEFVVSGGEYGYAAGDFFSAALEIVFEDLNAKGRYDRLETMVAHADFRHKNELRQFFPKIVPMVESTFSGEHTRDYSFGYCLMCLNVLPALLPLALPELADAIKDYGNQ